MYKILLVDDDDAVLKATTRLLETKNYIITSYNDSKEAILAAIGNDYDLIIVDYQMPNIDGSSFVDIYGSVKSNENIIIYSGEAEPRQECEMLSKNICDFISKDSDPEVFLMRIERALKRTTPQHEIADKVFVSEVEGIELDYTTRILRKNGKEVVLSSTEIMILALFLSHKQKPLSREYIHELVWEARNKELDDYRVIDVYILKLRKKLGLSCLDSIRGVGYVWREK